MDKKKSGLKRFFSKSKKDCCSIEIEETKNNDEASDGNKEEKEKEKQK